MLNLNNKFALSNLLGLIFAAYCLSLLRLLTIFTQTQINGYHLNKQLLDIKDLRNT